VAFLIRPARDFEVIQVKLAEAVSQLKTTADAGERVRILREMRLLLEIADALLDSGS
jgi:hypothetical protein